MCCAKWSWRRWKATSANCAGACGDRAVLRALHYYDENARVLEQAAAIRGGDLPAFFDAVKRSGDSSWKLLQNVYARSTEEQMAMGIELSRRFLHGDGAQRVHGGGFAGTIQAYVPLDRLDDYKKLMEDAFGPGSWHGAHGSPGGRRDDADGRLKRDRRPLFRRKAAVLFTPT